MFSSILQRRSRVFTWYQTRLGKYRTHGFSFNCFQVYDHAFHGDYDQRDFFLFKIVRPCQVKGSPGLDLLLQALPDQEVAEDAEDDTEQHSTPQGVRLKDEHDHLFGGEGGDLNVEDLQGALEDAIDAAVEESITGFPAPAAAAPETGATAATANLTPREQLPAADTGSSPTTVPPVSTPQEPVQQQPNTTETKEAPHQPNTAETKDTPQEPAQPVQEQVQQPHIAETKDTPPPHQPNTAETKDTPQEPAQPVQEQVHQPDAAETKDAPHQPDIAETTDTPGEPVQPPLQEQVHQPDAADAPHQPGIAETTDTPGEPVQPPRQEQVHQPDAAETKEMPHTAETKDTPQEPAQPDQEQVHQPDIAETKDTPGEPVQAEKTEETILDHPEETAEKKIVGSSGSGANTFEGGH